MQKQRGKFFVLAAIMALILPLLAADNTKQDAPPLKKVFENDFETANAGSLPDGMLVQAGEFQVRDWGTNKVLELPGSPLETFSVFFGPTTSDDVSVSARILGTNKGRRFPTFGVGLNGPSGYRLMMTPAKKALELYLNDDLQTSVPVEWKSDAWTNFRLRILKLGSDKWKVEGKAWIGTNEPADWPLIFENQTEPVAGRASVWGSPFAGTPIQFDDFAVWRREPK